MKFFNRSLTDNKLKTFVIKHENSYYIKSSKDPHKSIEALESEFEVSYTTIAVFNYDITKDLIRYFEDFKVSNGAYALNTLSESFILDISTRSERETKTYLNI